MPAEAPLVAAVPFRQDRLICVDGPTRGPCRNVTRNLPTVWEAGGIQGRGEPVLLSSGRGQMGIDKELRREADHALCIRGSGPGAYDGARPC